MAPVGRDADRKPGRGFIGAGVQAGRGPGQTADRQRVGGRDGGAAAGVVFDGYGGVINQVGAGDTAFVHRSAVTCAQYSVTYAGAPPAQSQKSTAAEWLDHLQQAFAPASQGSYQNYIDPTLTNWQQAYYGSNLPRLQQVKRQYDPDQVFRFAQSIPA